MGIILVLTGAQQSLLAAGLVNQAPLPRAEVSALIRMVGGCPRSESASKADMLKELCKLVFDEKAADYEDVARKVCTSPDSYVVKMADADQSDHLLDLVGEICANDMDNASEVKCLSRVGEQS